MSLFSLGIKQVLSGSLFVSMQKEGVLICNLVGEGRWPAQYISGVTPLGCSNEGPLSSVECWVAVGRLACKELYPLVVGHVTPLVGNMIQEALPPRYKLLEEWRVKIFHILDLKTLQHLDPITSAICTEVQAILMVMSCDPKTKCCSH